MNEQEQIKALAELDGFENIDYYFDSKPIPFTESDLKGTQDGLGESEDTLGRKLRLIPNYLHSRDAIVPLIEKQSNLVKTRFIGFLYGQVETDGSFELMEQDDLRLVFATPTQLCEALLRATGRTGA